MNMEVVAEKSAKVAYLLKQNPQLKLPDVLQDIPADPEVIDMVVNFCRGFEPAFSPENVIPLACLAFYLEMTESHCNDNLIKRVLIFFEQRVLTCWNATVKALRCSGCVLPKAESLGLFDACLQALVEKALVNPRLLGDPVRNDDDYDDNDDEEQEEEEYKLNARRRLFLPDWKSEDLTTLPLQVYSPIIHGMVRYQIPSQYVAGSLCSYAEKWVFCNGTTEDSMSMYKRNMRRDVIEAIERLLPDQKGLIPCTLLFKLLKHAITLESSSDCRHGFELRIGKQLHQATVKDLLIPSHGYTKETQYDIECVRRILKHFYGNYSTPDSSGFVPVAQLIEDFLTEVATDIDLQTNTFVNLAEISMSVSLGLQKNSDGLYRAVDIYFDKHRYLTEEERNEVCRVLDCSKLSPEACKHAATNKRLPLRFLVQVLFANQLHMRDILALRVEALEPELMKGEADEGKEEAGFEEEEVRAQMEKMSIKVKELEKKCNVMRKQIENRNRNLQKVKKETKKKSSVWKEMKRKLGCSSSINDCHCQVKKKKKVHQKI